MSHAHTPDRRAPHVERAIGAILGSVLVLVCVYALGASGAPGHVFAALIDWVIAQQPGRPDGAVLQAALLAWGA